MNNSSKEIVVTSGQPFTDIDALACALAYNELLGILRIPSRLVLPGSINESVGATLTSQLPHIETKLVGNPEDFFYVLVDISEPKFFASFVVPENVIGVFDHRWGFEKYWQDKLGVKAIIEPVGSCATLIWEKFKEHKVEDKISSMSADCLFTAILSNTLNFKAQISTDRDVKAAQEIGKYSQKPKDWAEKYFEEIQTSILNDPIKALENDTKDFTVEQQNYSIGQLELWDNKELFSKYKDKFVEFLSYKDANFFITSPSINEGINRIFCLHHETRQLLEKVLNAEFDGYLGTTPKLWLRKEIIREIENKDK